QITEDIAAKSDTLPVLHGRVSVLLKPGTFEVIKTDQLLQMYSSSFNIGKIICADGFKVGKNSSLKFYQTSIENPEINDGGLSTWKLIVSFTDKIPQNQWLESGWSKMTNGALMYSIKLISNERPETFSKFVFYY